MAYVPGQTLTVVDPGLGLVPSAASTFAYFGTASSGTNNAVTYYTSKKKVTDTLGQGPLAEALCTHLGVAGGPVIGVKVDHTGNEGTATEGTPVRAGSSIGTVAITGDPNDSYEGIIEIIGPVEGSDEVEFRYTLDGGHTYSPPILIPGGLVYAIPNTGLTVTFAEDETEFDAGDVFPFTATANHYDTTALNTAMQALKDSTEAVAVVVLCGQEADTSDGATMFAALTTHVTDLENGFRYVGGLMHAGNSLSAGVHEFATAKSDFANSVSSRIGVTFGNTRSVSQKPFTGWGVPLRPFCEAVAARAGASLISTHLGRFASGSLVGVVGIDYDEYLEGQATSAAKFIVPRTWPGAGGFYINRGNLRSPVGSDFDIWPKRRIMDVACDITFKALQPFMNSKIRVLKDGTGRIAPKAAAVIESRVNNALSQVLKVPTDAEGQKGHVAEVLYRVDLENNVQTTNQILGSVAVVPDAYAEEIITTLGFAAQAV
jgi:hypothetical protein